MDFVKTIADKYDGDIENAREGELHIACDVLTTAEGHSFSMAVSKNINDVFVGYALSELMHELDIDLDTLIECYNTLEDVKVQDNGEQ